MIRTLTLTGLLLVTLGLWPATVQAASDPKVQEYFVKQSADEHLVIRINGYEAAFSASISDQDGRELMRSGLPGTRLVPVFQYVNAPENDRQLNIEVSAGRYSNRADFSLEFTRLEVWDERSSAITRAYRMLAYGMYESTGESAADWSVKIDGLVNAGRLFQQFGMQEMRLWANYVAAHQVLHQLKDVSIAYSMTQDILSELGTQRFRHLELATLQLQAVALAGLIRGGQWSPGGADPQPLQTLLARSESMARAMGYDYEAAIALEASGNAYVLDAAYPEALEKYQQAVEIADAIDDKEFATQIRESMLKVHGYLGDTSASSDVLQEIETRLQEKGSTEELSVNLLEQGRLSIRHYRYEQALESLQKALALQNNSAVRRQVQLALAQVFYQTGDLNEALKNLRLAGFDSGNQRDPNFSRYDAFNAWWMLANIHRTRGEFESMRLAREKQSSYSGNGAFQSFSEGLDEKARGNDSGALALFEQAHRRAAGAGERDMADLSLLSYCALASAGAALCDGEAPAQALERLQRTATPRQALQARWLWSKILARQGRRSRAAQVMETLVTDIHLHQRALPGVLGSWYHENRVQVFTEYIRLLSPDGPDTNPSSALASLKALNQVRWVEQPELELPVQLAPASSRQLRTLIAQREALEAGQDDRVLSKQIEKAWKEHRNSFRQSLEFLSRGELEKSMAGLSADEAVLTFHLAKDIGQAWLMRQDGVISHKFINPAEISAELISFTEQGALMDLAEFDRMMESLGRKLLGPLAGKLPATLYFVPAGALSAFPLDALRMNGRYLLEDHQVVNLALFPLEWAQKKLDLPLDRQKSMVAGYPQDYTSEYALSLRTSPEIRAVTDFLIGPGLNIIQGAALLPDEFTHEGFVEASLVHMSMPGVIDLASPARSSLELSGYEGGTERAELRTLDIQSLDLQAGLVFLSQTRTRGRAPEFASTTGLVTEFITSGAHGVIARTWRSGGGASLSFIRDFYQRLPSTGDVGQALHASKRGYMLRERDNGGFDWAGYQWYVR
jgi:CHAT domain-containing protein/tetratricopeptide (TPR) repeat protein